MSVSNAEYVLALQDLASIKRKVRELNNDIIDALHCIAQGSDAEMCKAVIAQRSQAINKLLGE